MKAETAIVAFRSELKRLTRQINKEKNIATSQGNSKTFNQITKEVYAFSYQTSRLFLQSWKLYNWISEQVMKFTDNSFPFLKRDISFY